LGKGKKIGLGVGLGILGFFIFTLAGTMMIHEEEQELRNTAIEEEQELRYRSIQELDELSVSWEYKDVLRNIEKYKGKIIRFDGEIFRAETLGEDHYVLTVWGDLELEERFIVEYTGSRLLDGDTIRVYGEPVQVVELGSMLAPDWKTPYAHVKAVRLICTNC